MFTPNIYSSKKKSFNNIEINVIYLSLQSKYTINHIRHFKKAHSNIINKDPSEHNQNEVDLQNLELRFEREKKTNHCCELVQGRKQRTASETQCARRSHFLHRKTKTDQNTIKTKQKATNGSTVKSNRKRKKKNLLKTHGFAKFGVAV